MISPKMTKGSVLEFTWLRCKQRLKIKCLTYIIESENVVLALLMCIKVFLAKLWGARTKKKIETFPHCCPPPTTLRTG